MKKFSEQFYKKASTVKLQASEKRELRERLVSYMEYHPLPSSLKTAKKAKEKTSKTPFYTEAFVSFNIPFRTIFRTALPVMALILVATPFVAEKAVPGDALYAIKVRVNEELRSTLTFDSYQKVEWETERLNRRIAEARLLASEGKLTEEVEAGVAKAVLEHTANAQREIAELRVQDEDAATIASIAFDATLELQSNSLKSEDETVSDISNPEKVVKYTSLIANAIDESRSQTEEASASTTLPAYGKLVAKIEQNTTRIYELLNGLEKIALPEDLADAVRRYDDINRAIDVAVQTEANDDEAARIQLIEVLQRTQRLIVFLTEIEVGKTIDIETLIPVVLTEEEKVLERQALKAQMEEKLLNIDSILKKVSGLDKDIVAKVVSSRTSLDLGLAEINSTDVSYETFVTKMKELNAIADDMLFILDKNIVSGDSVEILEEDVSDPNIDESSTTTSSSTKPVEVSVEETLSDIKVDNV